MKILRVGATVVVLAAGVAGMVTLIKSRPEAKKVPPQQRGVLVEVMSAQARSFQVPLVVRGTVQAAREVSLVPQVSGLIVEQHPQLTAGGLVKAGELLLRLDDADYVLATAQRRAQVEQAEQALELERGRKSVAVREWKLMGEGVADKGTAGRATREPQVRSAEAILSGARSAQRQAAIAQARTRIVAPFNALVLQESVDEGQLVGPNGPVARLADTDHFFVEVLVPLRDLPLIRLPDAPGERGARATVMVQAGERQVEREGYVIRRLGELDPQSRMARVVVEVPDPLGLQAPAEPLLLRSYVEVHIEGPAVDNLIALPRSAVHEGGLVYTVTGENRLEIKPIQEARRMGDDILVRAGLTPGERVITSRIPGPVEGMLLRVKGDEKAVAQAPGSQAPGSHANGTQP